MGLRGGERQADTGGGVMQAKSSILLDCLVAFVVALVVSLIFG